MPFYEYECSSCKFYTEVMQKISDAPLAKCPSCGKKAMVKLISAPIFRLKGGGWYETDFKGDKEGKRNLAGSDEDSAAKSESSSSSAAGKSDSPPKADGAKSESAKAEPAKTEAAKPESKVESKPSPSTRRSAARTAKPPVRASTGKSAGKTRPAPARASSNSKAKAKPARKKARR
jgi:putative FmdB family regulatory protein